MTLASVPILAAFISPALFFGGASVVAAPILIHLLARRRFKRIRWAAMEFLIDAERRNRRRIRMEEWILLALRCLAVVLIALMIARPFLKPTSAAAFLGGSQRTERVFVVDDSFSMAYAGPDGTPFSRAKLAVRRLLDSIREESPDDTVTLLRMSAPTAPVESGTYLDDTQTEELLARLDALTPSQRAVDPARAVEGVAEILERSPDVTSAVVYFISDFQRYNWIGVEGTKARRDEGTEGKSGLTGAEESPRRVPPSLPPQGLFDPLTAWSTGDRGLHVVLIDVSEDEPANLAVTELGLHGGQLVVGAVGAARAKIANFGPRSVENVELQINVSNLDQPSHTLRELPAQQSVTVDLEVEFFRAGFEAVRLELPDDPLPIDNVRYVAADVASAIRVVIVNGEASPDDYDDEVAFLTTALRPEGEVFSGNEAVVLDETQLEEINLGEFHVAILANVYRISDPAVEALEHFVRRGGGLMIFLGDQVDADLYNAAFFRDGEGLLPAELTEVIRAADASHLIVTDRLHPAMRGISREGDPLGIGQIAFFEYFGCVPYGGRDEGTEGRRDEGMDAGESLAIPPVRGSDSSHDPSRVEAPRRRGKAALRQPAARVIARFDDVDEHPAIVERSFGLGRVILITTAADKEWHQWPDHPTFLPVMMELVRHTARQTDSGAETWVGDTIEIPLDPGAFELDAIVRTPAYPNEREVGLTAVAGEDQRGMVLRWEHTETAGLYQFLLKRRDGGEIVRLVAVNVDPAESDLTAAQEDELRRALGDVSFEYHKGIDSLAGGTGEARTELWRFVLFGAVMVLLLEQGLAFVWGRRA